MLRDTRGYLVAFLVVIAICGTFAANAQSSTDAAPVPRLITSPIDNAARVTVVRSTHPLAQNQFDRGPADPGLLMDRMILVLGPSAEQEHQLRTFLDSQQSKGSPDYHHWLTPQEFGQKFGPAQQDIDQVIGWLQQQGFSVGSVAKSGRWVEFSGNAAQVQSAFQTQMRTYQVGGETHLANASDISIPAAVAPVVRGVVSLHNFFSKPMHRNFGTVHQTGSGSYVHVNPDGTFGLGVHALSPGDYANIYNLNPLYSATPTHLDGTGQTIAIVARSDIDLTDIAQFRTNTNLPANIPNVIVNGPDPGDVPGDDLEATLDVEWSGAVAPGATIDIVISAITATTDGVDLSAAYIVDNNLAQVMSTSFNLCEQLLGPAENAFINSLWEQASAQGISAFVSSGDDGAAACDDPNNPPAAGPVSVGGLSSTPFNTAVGGTEFNETVNGGSDATFWNATNATGFVSVKGYIPEMVWNESCAASCGSANPSLFAGSGGLSTLYATPSWQSPALSIPGLNFSMRAVPDVSLTAAGHDGYLVCFQQICQNPGAFDLVGGTSASSPSFAGIMAIVDQKIGSRQGLANYVLYKLAQAENFNNCNSSNRTNPATGTSCVFNDTTVGNNNVPGETGFNAVTGYDLATGLGSVDATNLVNAWAGNPFTGSTTTFAANPVQNPITIAHGSSLNFNVSVAKMSGSATPSGTVALIASGGTLTGPVGIAATTVSGSGGTANGSFTGIGNLPGGTAYNLVAHYPGDGTFGASDSTAIPVTVTPEGSATSLTSIVGFTNTGTPILGTTIAYGDPLDLRTVVTSSTNASPPDGFPSGTITINDNSVTIGTLKLNTFGQSELINCSTPAPTSVPCLSVGSHPIQIVYAGDVSFTGSSTANPAVTITVNKANPGRVLTAPATANFNQQITLQAQLVSTGGTLAPTGTVQFFQGTSALGSPVTLVPGSRISSASTQVALTGIGNQTVSAQYSGDASYNSATVGSSTVVVGEPFNFTSAVTSGTIHVGSIATFSLTLNAVGGFTGQVSFNCTGATSGVNCAVSPNPATLGTSVPVTVTVSNTANARVAPPRFRSWQVALAGMLAGVLWGLRKKPRKATMLLLVLAVVIGVGSCGGGGNPPVVTQTVTNQTLVVTGTSGSATNSITLSLAITHP